MPLLFLSGCSWIGKDQPAENTWNLQRISELEQQLSGLIAQFSGLQQENELLRTWGIQSQNNAPAGDIVPDTISTTKEIWLIKQVYTDQYWNKKLEIDYIQLWWQDECNWWVTCIINQNPKLRTFTIANDAEIIMQTLTHTSDGNYNNNQSISFDYFKQKFNDTTSYGEYPNNYSQYLKAIPYRITISNNIITKIEEQYMS